MTKHQDVYLNLYGYRQQDEMDIETISADKINTVIEEGELHHQESLDTVSNNQPNEEVTPLAQNSHKNIVINVIGALLTPVVFAVVCFIWHKSTVDYP